MNKWTGSINRKPDMPAGRTVLCVDPDPSCAAALQDAWVEHHDSIANATLVARTNSWYMGSNVAGKPRRLLSYIGGVGQYRQKCAEIADQGYPGFDMQ